MTFQQHLNIIQNIITTNNLYVPKTRMSGRCEVHDISGIVEGRSVYIFINYTRQSITWRDQDSGEEKTF